MTDPTPSSKQAGDLFAETSATSHNPARQPTPATSPDSHTANNTRLSPALMQEVGRTPPEPLLKAEKILIIASLVLGIILLAVLYLVSATIFPPPHPPSSLGR